MLKLNKILLALSLALPLSSWAASYYVVVPFKKAATVPSQGAQIGVSLSQSVLTNAQVGQPYAADLSAMLQVTGDSSFSGAGVTWAVESGALPAGLTLGANGTISGTPTAAGTSSFTVKATYKTKSGQQTYSILAYNILVNLGAATPPNGMIGQAYSFNLNSLLSSNDPAFTGAGVTWSVVSNTLPAGLYLTNDGYIGGTPTDSGTGSLTARATYKGANGDQSYTVVVPAITIALADTTFPDGKIQTNYTTGSLSSLVTVTGDATYSPSSLSWTLSSGSLPTGLSLSGGAITGKPTATASGTFELTASYKGKSAAKSYAITIYPAASCKELLTLAPSTPSGWYTLDVDGSGATAAKSYYCDMVSDGGGWTRVVRQTEAAPVTNWNGGVNGQSYALAQNELPAHTQIGIGKDESATFIDYVNGTYQATDMASVVTLTSPKTGFQYQMYHHVGNFYRFNNPEETFYEYPTNNNPFGDGDWRNALTFDKTGSRAFTWSFAPQHATPAARGFGFNGASLAGTSESYAWTVWVR